MTAADPETAVGPGSPHPVEGPVVDPAVRVAALVFAGAAVVACVTIMVMNRRQWFFHDDFVFAFDRDLGAPHTLMQPHFGHNTALPAIVFRLIYGVVGLHAFWPYQLLVIASHVSVAAVLRALMLRCRVDVVLATSAAILFLFFGSGRENLTWAFQTTLNGSIAFGFGALLLADHDGAVERRDHLAGALLCAAVLCSNMGPFMVGVVAVSIVLRRGPRPVLPVVGPALVLFMVWRFTAPDGREAFEASDLASARAWASELVAFGFRSLTHLPPLTVFLELSVLVAIVGFVHATARDGWRPDDAVPVSIIIGLVAAAASLGYTRGAFVYPPFPRYTYLVTVFALPTVAWALGRIAGDRRPFVFVAAGLLLLGLPANIVRIGPSNDYDEGALGDLSLISALAEVAATENATRGYEVYGFITNDGLIDAYRSGKVPTPDIPTEVRNRARIMVALGTATGPAIDCRTVDHTGPVALERGDRLEVESDAVRLSLASAPTTPVVLHEVPETGGVRGYDIVVDRVDLVVRPVTDGTEVRVCRIARP